MKNQVVVHAAPSVLLIVGISLLFFGFDAAGKCVFYMAAAMQVWSVLLSASWLKRKRIAAQGDAKANDR
jgi:predicted tellurium resistance membrane protein TerC